MHCVNYAINGFSSWRTTPRSLTLEENIVGVNTRDRVIHDNLKRQIKTELCILVDYSY